MDRKEVAVVEKRHAGEHPRVGLGNVGPSDGVAVLETTTGVAESAPMATLMCFDDIPVGIERNGGILSKFRPVARWKAVEAAPNYRMVVLISAAGSNLVVYPVSIGTTDNDDPVVAGGYVWLYASEMCDGGVVSPVDD